MHSKLAALREEHANYLTQQKRDAEYAVKLMQPSVMRAMQKEQEIHGKLCDLCVFV
jgi:hypothetical protein